jgi:hypothetical protein
MVTIFFGSFSTENFLFAFQLMMCFFICGLFHGTVTSSDYVVPGGKIIGEE